MNDCFASIAGISYGGVIAWLFYNGWHARQIDRCRGRSFLGVHFINGLDCSVARATLYSTRLIIPYDLRAKRDNTICSFLQLVSMTQPHVMREGALTES